MAVIRSAMRHSKRFRAGAKARKGIRSGKDKFDTVMAEYARGPLHSGDGSIVKDKDQALAIAFSEARKVDPQFGKRSKRRKK